MADIVLPELGEGIEQATVACWHVAVGDQVNQDDDVVEMVTDKATFNVSAPEAGSIKEIHFEKGQEAPIGATLAEIES